MGVREDVEEDAGEGELEGGEAELGVMEEGGGEEGFVEEDLGWILVVTLDYCVDIGVS